MLEWSPLLQLVSIIALTGSTFIGDLLIIPRIKKVKLNAYVYILIGYTMASFSGIFGLLGFFENSITYYKIFIATYTLALIPVYLVFRRSIYNTKALILDILFFSSIYLEILFIYYNPLQTVVIDGRLIIIRSRDLFGWIIKLLDHSILAFTIFYVVCRSTYIRKKNTRIILAIILFITSASFIFILTIFTLGYLSTLHYFAYSVSILTFAVMLYKWPEVFITSGLQVDCIGMLDKDGIEVKKLMLKAFDDTFYRSVIKFIYQTQVKPKKKEPIYVIIEGRTVISIPINNHYLFVMGKNMDKDLIHLLKYRLLSNVSNSSDLNAIWSKALNLLT